MPAYQNGTQYEIWVARDDGTRLSILDRAGEFTYTRALNNVGSFSITLPVGFDVASIEAAAGIQSKFGPSRSSNQKFLAKDRRIYIWRKPEGGVLTLAFEGFLRRIITKTDSAGNTRRIIQGPGLNYLLAGRHAAYPERSTEANTNVDTTVTPVAADDMMKAIVRTNLGSTATTANGRKASGVISATYFGVAADLTLGPTISMAFSYRNVLDICREICDASRAASIELYFEIVPVIEDGTQHTVEFRTYRDQPGKDRTSDSAGGGLTFGLDFGNMSEPELIEDAWDEVNRSYGLGGVRGISVSENTTLQAASLWALREGTAPAFTIGTVAGVLDFADAGLTAGRPVTTLTAKLLSVDGYIYGKHWDFGDRVTVTYDGRQGDALVRAVTISVDENSDETIDAQIETYLV